MKKLLLVFVCMHSCVTDAWTIFPPKNATECVEKNLSKVKFLDAAPLLGAACQIGYDKGEFKKEWISAGKCIVEDASRLYSYDESTKVINSCTDNREAFNVYMGALNQRQRSRAREQEEAQARQEQERRRESDRLERRIESERRINELREATRELNSAQRICHRVGSMVECF